MQDGGERMVLNTQQFRLLVDPLFGSDVQSQPSASGDPQAILELSYLALPSDSPVWLGLDSVGQPSLTAGDTRSKTSLCCLEPVYHTEQPLLVFLCPRSDRQQPSHPRLNGQPAPTVAVLGIGDQLQVGSHVLHVTIYNQPVIGAATDEQVGRDCAYCRLPIAAGATIYHCPCGAILHSEAEATDSADEPLRCLQNVTLCPACQESIRLEKGYLYEPAL